MGTPQMSTPDMPGGEQGGGDMQAGGPGGFQGFQGFGGTPDFNYGDVHSVLGAQNQANQQNVWQQQMANRFNQSTPFGSASWMQDPNTGQMTWNQQVSGPQGMINAQREAADIVLGEHTQPALWNATGAVQKGFNYEGLNDPGQLSFAGIGNQAPSDFSQDRNRIEGTLMDRFSRRMDPQFQQQNTQLEQQLANQGIPRGSELFDKEMNRMSQQQGDARLNAQAQAVQMGGGEQQRMFGMSQQARDQATREAMQQYGAGVESRQRGAQERITQREQPFRDLQNIWSNVRGYVPASFQAPSQLNIPGQQISPTAYQYYAQQNPYIPPRGGGGGGGGGGSSSFMNFLGGIL